MAEALGFEVALPLAFDAAVATTREALKAEGFGILTEIDLRAAFKEKLGREFRPYVILGACNPPLAFAAVTAEPAVGLLLPCNVTVEETADGKILVAFLNPRMMRTIVGKPALDEIAEEAYARLSRVADSLKS